MAEGPEDDSKESWGLEIPRVSGEAEKQSNVGRSFRIHRCYSISTCR